MDSTVIRARFSLEEIEYLTQGRHLAGTPRSSGTALTFSLNPTNAFYALAVGETGLFQPFVKTRELEVEVVIGVLRRLREMMGREEERGEDRDVLSVRFLQLAAFFFLVFFILIIASGYYSDAAGLWIAAAIMSSLGLALLAGLLATGGDCRKIGKRLGSSGFVLSTRKRKEILDYLAVVNREIVGKEVQWRLSKTGSYLQLHVFSA